MRPFPLAIGFAACAALAAPIGPFADEVLAAAGEPEEETTISIRQKGETAPTVLQMPEMRAGEIRTVTSESGNAVTVTRTDNGYKIRIGEKDIDVRTEVGGGGEVDRIIVMHGEPRAHAYAFRSAGSGGGACQKVQAKELLEKQDLKALVGVDARTRETVEKAIDELIAKGALAGLVPRVGLLEKTAIGDGVEVRVEKKIRIEKK